VATFYAPYTRMWELLCGAVLACIASHNTPARESRHSRLADATAATGLLMLLYSVMRFSADSVFPGTRAIVPVLGAVLIILGGPAAWINRVVLSTRGLVWIGLISFPLYLWHWPLLAFARIIQAHTPGLLAWPWSQRSYWLT
jgi:peptidoglycan/LPS O-acetylase OafA/YrhL